MKTALGILTTNEEYFLNRHLPILAPCFDGIVAVDGMSTDGTVKILESFGAEVWDRKWDNNFAEARNALIDVAEAFEYDWIFMLDADECMFPDDIKQVRQYMEDHEFIGLPRIEFVRDYQHFDQTLYPDFQGRVFKLGVGFHFRGKIHEMLFKGEGEEAILGKVGERLIVPNCHIYHYGRCLSPEKLWLKYRNYDRLIKGEELLTEIPAGTEIKPSDFWKSEIKYRGLQPV